MLHTIQRIHTVTSCTYPLLVTPTCSEQGEPRDKSQSSSDKYEHIKLLHILNLHIKLLKGNLKRCVSFIPLS